MKNIVETAQGNEMFSTLVTAVVAANPVETLSGEGPFTVFAPTNDAFAKVPADALAALLADPAQLASVLTYHVVAGKVMAADVVDMTEATTVEGSTIAIEVVDGSVMLNESKVTATDIECSNGVIHVIDTVLMPS